MSCNQDTDNLRIFTKNFSISFTNYEKTQGISHPTPWTKKKINYTYRVCPKSNEPLKKIDLLIEHVIQLNALQNSLLLHLYTFANMFSMHRRPSGTCFLECCWDASSCFLESCPGSPDAFLFSTTFHLWKQEEICRGYIGAIGAL